MLINVKMLCSAAHAITSAQCKQQIVQFSKYILQLFSIERDKLMDESSASIVLDIGIRFFLPVISKSDTRWFSMHVLFVLIIAGTEYPTYVLLIGKYRSLYLNERCSTLMQMAHVHYCFALE